MIFQPITRTYVIYFFTHLLQEHARVRGYLNDAFSLSVRGSLNSTSSFIFCHLLFKGYSLKIELFVPFSSRYISFLPPRMTHIKDVSKITDHILDSCSMDQTKKETHITPVL